MIGLVSEWLTFGFYYSVYADPLFRNAAGRDFRLSPESPAFKLGFVDFDQGDIRPRKAEDESKGSYRTDS